MRQAANPNADSDEEEEEEEGYQSDSQAILESTTRRMIKCELEDFELVRTEFSLDLLREQTSSVGSVI